MCVCVFKCLCVGACVQVIECVNGCVSVQVSVHFVLIGKHDYVDKYSLIFSTFGKKPSTNVLKSH